MYSLDPNAARKADTIGGMITDIGKYVGVLTQAVDIKASTGTRGIALEFKSTAGQKAKVSIYTEKPDGTKLMGFDMLMAIMTCLGLRTIEPKNGQYLRWNSETRAEEKVNGLIFPDLCNKPIGFLLETEDYEKNGGGVGSRIVLKAVFQSSTELTATEILDRKTQPEQLARMVLGLRHRPLRNKSTSRPNAATTGGGSGFDDMDDDIPF